MKKITLIFYVFLSCIINAQTPVIEWQKVIGGTSFNEYPTNISQTSDGGYILAGNTNSTDGNIIGNHGNTDMLVIKLSSIGVIEWQKCYGGSNNDEVTDFQQTSDGGYILLGYTNSTDGDVLEEECYGWLIKLNSLGVIQWQTCLDVIGSIKQTIEGGYVVAGLGDDVKITKLTSAGVVEWTENFGGTGADVVQSIIQTVDGGYVFAGYTTSNDGDVFGNHGQADGLIVKLSSIGEIQWQKCYGGSNNEDFSNIIQTFDGGYVVSGNARSNNGDVFGNHNSDPQSGGDIWTVKLSSIGEIQWQKCIGGSEDDAYPHIEQTFDGNFIIVATTNSDDGDAVENHGEADGLIVKLSSIGQIQWQKCYGGSNGEMFAKVQQTLDGGYILAGIANSTDGDVQGLNSINGTDIWIVKLSDENLSISLFNSESISFFPNPIKNDFTINTSETIKTVEIFDLLGKRVFHQNNSNDKINVDFLSKGMYLVKINTENQTFNSKIIKE